MRIQVQGWDVEASNEVVVINIANTNLRNMDTKWSKVEKYIELYKTGNTDYPAVIVERYKETNHFEIIDGAHRIKALNFLGVETVNARLVIQHN